ncbi:glycosyltransferase family 39 protein, partial [Nonomuraea rhizosphaerae]|uniref:glycosyltransferase family 39 protein n=1 Tax=Nonomuraea rhizosphaerae TaxID=2665663 RepID=UPI001C5E5B6B
MPWPVWLVAALLVAVLLSLSAAYGFHGDEMYFVVAGRHPAFGYVDQPPLTPLLSAASVALLGVSPTAARILPTLEMATIVVIAGFITRDLGGSRRAQVLAAVATGVSGYIGAGHLNTTTQPDLLIWAVMIWLLVRLLAGGDRRLWLAVGLSAGIGLENKDTPLFLAAGLVVGILLCRRWEVLRSPWAWAAALIATVMWIPNLAWQATNGWPQLTMASQIAGYASANRAQALPLLWLFTGPLLFPVCIAGLAWVLGSRAAAPWRPLGVAALVAMALVLISGGKAYYAIGSTVLFMAAGGIVLDRWIARGHRRLKIAGFGAATAGSAALIALLTLPVLPV